MTYPRMLSTVWSSILTLELEAFRHRVLSGCEVNMSGDPRKLKLRKLDRYINRPGTSAQVKKTLQQIKRIANKDPSVDLIKQAVELGDIDAVELLIGSDDESALAFISDADMDTIRKCTKLALEGYSGKTLEFLYERETYVGRGAELMELATKHNLFHNLLFFQHRAVFDFGLKWADEMLTKILTPEEVSRWMYEHFDTYRRRKIRLNCTLSEVIRRYGVKILDYIYVRFPTMGFDDDDVRNVVEDDNYDALKWLIDHSEQYIAQVMEQILNRRHFYAGVDPPLQPRDEEVDAERCFTSSKSYCDGYIECVEKLGDPDRALRLFCEFRTKLYVGAIGRATYCTRNDKLLDLLESERSRWKSGDRTLGYRNEFRTFRDANDGATVGDEFSYCIGEPRSNY